MATLISAQPMQEKNHAVLLLGLEKIIKKGNKRSLRDLGSLLDKKEFDTQVRQILKHHTIFSEEEIDITKASRSEFLLFFYEQQTKIRYSELFGAFYITPVEERALTYKAEIPKTQNSPSQSNNTQLLVDNYVLSYQKKDAAALIEIIYKLGETGSDVAVNFLESQLFNETMPAAFSGEELRNCYIALVKATANKPSYKTLTYILGLIDQGLIPFEPIQYSLSRFTNIPSSQHSDASTFIQAFEHLSDSLYTLSAIRIHGYDQLLPFKSYFFFEDVDYYGKIYCQKNQNTWLSENAFRDMLTTHHPRMLLYLASYIYKYRKQKNAPEYRLAIAMMEQFTKIPVNCTTAESYRQFLFYWWQSYDSFEWNNENNLFVNKEERVKRLEEYDTHFRRLNSKNDEAALAAYLKLAKGHPKEVTKLLQKYRPLLRTINSKLPPLKAGYLEQFVALNAFCQKNQIHTTLSTSLSGQLEQLAQSTIPKDIYKLESSIIKSLHIDDLTALEIWAILRTKDRATNMSVSRILDIFYSIHWESIQNDAKQLRLFLKKAQLFKAIGVSGICNSYLNKIDVKNTTLQEQIKELLLVETDEGIRSQIAQILTNQTSKTNSEQATVAKFIKNPLLFNKIEIQVLPSPSLAEIKSICKSIKQTKDKQQIKQYFTFLSYFATITAVPSLFELINEKTILIKNENHQLTVGQRVVPILEDIYDYSFNTEEKHTFSTAEWLKLWKDHRKYYLLWSEIFLAKKIKVLEAKEELSIDELNEFIEQTKGKPKFIQQSLELLPKIRPVKNIRRLNLTQKLNPETDLHFFKNLGFNHKQLDDVSKHFEITNAVSMLDYLEAEAIDFEPLDKAAFYNSLFHQKWFLSHILSGKISNERVNHYTESLQFYLDESDYLSEYEEQRILQNLTNLSSIGKPVSAKLEATLSLDADDKLKANIQQDIIAHIDYSEIGIVASYIPYLNQVPGQNTYDFLNKDFGLPIFIMDSLAMVQLIENHSQMTEAEFYRHYLVDFGLDFLTDGQLDFNKIYRILQFDLVSPLTGSGGSKRDYFVYGLIKLLEIHFDTRLDFHKKLNESQTFYTFTSNKRSKAWLAYLEENQLIHKEQLLAPSFNTTRDLASMR